MERSTETLKYIGINISAGILKFTRRHGVIAICEKMKIYYSSMVPLTITP